MNIHTIFPTAIGYEYNNITDDEEHTRLKTCEYHKHEKYNMTVSKDKYIINSVPNIKQFIQHSLNKYSESILATKARLKFTQSWCTKHANEKQYTFPHCHQNSIISGVYYVSASQDSEGLTFYKDNPLNDRYITWTKDQDLINKHEWNWEWQKFNVKQGMLILFPSHLKHAVEGKTFTGDFRCALAFNTWFEDPIGCEDNFSRLKI